MFHACISQLTTTRWELAEELAGLADHGFDRLSLWRPKLSDVGSRTTATLLRRAGIRASSLQWAGGFTGGDGRTFAESLEDAAEAIVAAAMLDAPVLVVHAGCRGGHTRTHARRLLVQAIERLAPIAEAAGVTLAIKPFHAATHADCCFLGGLAEGLDVVESVAHPAIGLALDLWQFADAAEFTGLLPRLAAAAAIVHVADREGPPSRDMERLPVGRGGLPLEQAVLDLFDHGYRGDFEFDPVGEAVASLGYVRVLAETRGVADAWQMAAAERLDWSLAASSGWYATDAGSSTEVPEPPGQRRAFRGGHFRGFGSRRSQASNQTVSRG